MPFTCCCTHVRIVSFAEVADRTTIVLFTPAPLLGDPPAVWAPLNPPNVGVKPCVRPVDPNAAIGIDAWRVSRAPVALFVILGCGALK